MLPPTTTAASAQLMASALPPAAKQRWRLMAVLASACAPPRPRAGSRLQAHASKSKLRRRRRGGGLAGGDGFGDLPPGELPQWLRAYLEAGEFDGAGGGSGGGGGAGWGGGGGAGWGWDGQPGDEDQPPPLRQHAALLLQAALCAASLAHSARFLLLPGAGVVPELQGALAAGAAVPLSPGAGAAAC